MGTKGAAIATGVSQTIGLLILLTRFARRQGNLCFGRTKLNAHIFQDIIVHGLPEGISQLSNPVMTLCMNFVLIQRIGDLGVNAFSVIAYIASFCLIFLEMGRSGSRCSFMRRLCWRLLWYC